MLSTIDKFVEQLEDDIHRGRFTLEELHVVDDEHIGVPIAVLKILIALLVLVVRRDGGGVVVQEFGGIHVDRVHRRIGRIDVVLYRPQQMGFSKPGVSIYEQGIQHGFHAWLLRNGESHGIGETVRISNNVVFERQRGDDSRIGSASFHARGVGGGLGGCLHMIRRDRSISIEWWFADLGIGTRCGGIRLRCG